MWLTLLRYFLSGTFLISTIILIVSYWENNDVADLVNKQNVKKINKENKFDSLLENIEMTFLGENKKMTIKSEVTKKKNNNIYLTKLSGTLKDNDGTELIFNADKGEVHLNEKKVYLIGKTMLFSENIGEITTDKVTVDYNNFTSFSENKVLIKKGEMTITSNGFRLIGKGSKLILKQVTITFQ